ncbi:MAG TPA: hypothetical protein VGL66_04280 [Caulobacteraceae bacterium]|jgi:hypothetical protein
MPEKKPEKPEKQDLEHQEALLDEALEESFPASDPPAPAHLDPKDEDEADPD